MVKITVDDIFGEIFTFEVLMKVEIVLVVC
jgi:hypothetical protein